MEETRKPARKARAKSAVPKAGKPKARPAAKAPVRRAPAPAPARREEMVRMAAYFRAERRGFAPGSEWDDWLAAEAEVDALVEPAAKPAPRKVPARKTARVPKAPRD
jgi:hypothetical protein